MNKLLKWCFTPKINLFDMIGYGILTTLLLSTDYCGNELMYFIYYLFALIILTFISGVLEYTIKGIK